MAYDLPSYELFSKFTVPVMNSFLGSKSQTQAESIWLLP